MNQPNLTPDLLRTFIAIVETGGFIRAAKHLHKTQSTISQHIKRLEHEAGITLFTSAGRQRRLTPAGEIMLGYAKRLLSLQDETLFAISQDSLQDEVKIGVSHNLSEGVFPELLGQFSRSYPDIKMVVETGYSDQMIRGFDRGEYDLTLTLEQNVLNGEILSSEDLLWIGGIGPERPRANPLRLAAYSGPCQFRKLGTNALDQANIPWQVVYNANSLQGVLAAVRAGIGITIQLKRSITRGTAIIPPKAGLPSLPQVHIVLRNRVKGQAGKLLAAALTHVTRH